MATGRIHFGVTSLAKSMYRFHAYLFEGVIDAISLLI